MVWHRRLFVSVLMFLPLAGCEDMRARRFPPVTAPKDLPSFTLPKETKPDPLPPHYGWLEPRQRLDVPIEFVTEQSGEWSKLKEFWNEFPGPVGLGLWPLALPPLERRRSRKISSRVTVATPIFSTSRPPAMFARRMAAS